MHRKPNKTRLKGWKTMNNKQIKHEMERIWAARADHFEEKCGYPAKQAPFTPTDAEERHRNSLHQVRDGAARSPKCCTAVWFNSFSLESNVEAEIKGLVNVFHAKTQKMRCGSGRDVGPVSRWLIIWDMLEFAEEFLTFLTQQRWDY